MAYTTPFNKTGNVIKIGMDKILTINGKKHFPQIMLTLTSNTVPMSTNVANLHKLNMYTADFAGYGYQAALLPTYINEGLGVIPMVGHFPVNSPALFGYYQEDEPDISKHATLKGIYDEIKAADQNHIVIMGAWHDGKWWEDTADAIWYGLYPYTHTLKWIVDLGPWEQTQYKYEYIVKTNILLGYDNFDQTNRPFWPVIQSLSKDDDAQKSPTTLAETKALCFNAICMNVKGLAYWSFSWTPNDAGLYHNETKVQEHILMVSEMRLIEDILLLPTADYSWEFRKGSTVTFSNPLTGTWRGYQNFNWMLKHDGTLTYLIVVNKDPRPCTTDIIISGINGTGQVQELGLQGTGAQPGRMTTHSNGRIVGETFQGLGVKIYKIVGSGNLPPVKYACINGTCQESTQGYDTLTLCQQNCAGGARYDCVNGTCVQASNGEYPSIEACNSQCLQGGVIPQGEGTMYAIVGVMAGYLILKAVLDRPKTP